MVDVPWFVIDLFALTGGKFSEIDAVMETDAVLVWEFQLLKIKQNVEVAGGRK